MNTSSTFLMNRRHFLAAAAAGLLARAFSPRLPARGADASLGDGCAKTSPIGKDASSFERWLRAPRIPVLDLAGADADDPLALLRPEAVARARELTFGTLFASIREQDRISFRYDGGSLPGQRREVTPAGLFRVEGFAGVVYLSGYCHAREETRTFHLGRMRELIRV